MLRRMKSLSITARAPRDADSAVPLEELLSYQICILAKLIERTSASELDKA